MMGMKKFSSGRKQVLNLDGSPNENRPSWKSKYEQICAVHVNNGDPVSPKEEEDERIEPKKSTALIGLSGYHSTESSSDDSDLEDEVRSFLREVDNIYIVERAKPIVKPPTNPTVEKIQKLAKEMQARQNMSAERKGDPAGPKAPTNTTAWQECYDNSTGFTYYWNMETNDVTWDMPLEYQAYVEALKHWQQQQANGVVARMQQARAQHLQQQHQQQQHQQQQIQQKQEIQTLLSLPKPPKEERVFKYCKKKKKDSDDEKIELITSYGPNSGDEDWSDQETSTKKKKDKTDKTEKKSVETSHKTYHHRRKEEPRPIGSLVPYHHDDSESDEPQASKEDEIKLKLASKIREIQSSDSNSNVDDESAERLKCQDIDSESKLKINLKSKITARAKQMATTLGTFENPELSEDSKDKDDFVSTVSNPFSSETNNLIENTSGVGIKRKLKIEIPQPPRKEESPFRDSVKDAEKAKETDGSKRQKIEKIQFIKAETLQPQKEENTAETDAIDIKDVSNLLLDKMKFLSASKDPVSAVQLWTIQLETLVSAWESNDLKRSYISDWLTNTMKELERLESTVAPEGWLCQWQRKEKCYSYTNERTGRVVWEFPQASDMDEKDAEKIGGEEDMEVCTTPPPPSSPPIRDPSPPPPPNISPPTPPPPPSISHPDENPILPPLPPLPPPSEPPTPPPPPPDEPPPHLLMEPLPPGVDAPELLRPMPLEYPVAIPSQIGMHLIPQLHYTLYPQPTLASALALQPRISKSGDLSSELDSFYSDLASLEPAEQPSQPSLPSKESTPPPPQTPTLDTTDAAAKKKKKTKLAPGLALKKKGVSSLVAKWQQVQEDVRRDLKNIDN